MPVLPASRLTMPRTPTPVAAIVAVTLAAGISVLLLPTRAPAASIWSVLATAFPESAGSGYALGWASLVGALAYCAADAVTARAIVRPAMTAALAAALFAPVGLAAPLWAGLLCAAGMLAAPAMRRPSAANDNHAPERLSGNPFMLAA